MNGDTPEPAIETPDEEHPEVLAGRKRMDDFWIPGMRLIVQYEGNRVMAFECFLLAIGQGEMIGCRSAVELAVKLFKDPAKKAAVSKCVNRFRDCLNIPAMPGQREEAGRVAMSEARKKQLKPK